MKGETSQQAAGYRFFRVQYFLAAAILFWAWQSSGSNWPTSRPASLTSPFLSSRGLLVLLSIGFVLKACLLSRARRTQCKPAFSPPWDIPTRDRAPCGPTEQAVLLLDSNIWMNAALDGFFSTLKRQLLQCPEHVTLFGPQFDEICNLKDRQPVQFAARPTRKAGAGTS